MSEEDTVDLNTKKLIGIHSDALREFDEIQSTQSSERQQSYNDRRFYSIAGAQWEGALSSQFENKPKLEVNKIHLAVIRIINQFRNNRITVDFVSKDGSDAGDLASVCDGLYRADEQDSCAEEAYDNAFEEAVGGGIGAFRYSHEYEDEDDDENEHQRIKITPIFDADRNVFFDAGAKRQDKSDATRCFVLTPMTRSAYEEEYGDDVSSWDSTVLDGNDFDWASDDSVYVAEYFKVEKQPYEVIVFEDLAGKETRYTSDDFERNDDLLPELLSTGHTEIRRKKVKRRRVHKYILSGGGVLEDCGYIAGPNIPVVPVYGKRWVVDNIERFMGHVRLAKDAQRLKNVQLSKLAEIAAASGIETPIVTPEQISGHQNVWQNHNINNYAYLTINALTDAAGNPVATGPVAYTKPPVIPPALGALLQVTETDIKDLLGNQEAGEQMMSNISGVTVERIQERLDMQSYIYISNFAKALKRGGEVWLGMAREILVEDGRKMKIIGRQKEVSQITLMQNKMDDLGEVYQENDLTKASFDVAVDVGPSSASKKSSALRTLLNILQVPQVSADPETVQVLVSEMMSNLEGEGMEDVRDYFRNKLIKMGVVKPTETEQKQLAEEAEQAASLPPSPNDLLLTAAAERETADAAKARMDTLLTQARTEETQAKTIKIEAEAMETLASIDIEAKQTAIDAVQAIDDIM
jgi:hypothetical protein